MSGLSRFLMITFAVCAGFAGSAQASDCAFTPAPATRLQSMTTVTDYQSVLKACIAAEAEYAYNDQVDLSGFQWQPRTCPVG